MAIVKMKKLRLVAVRSKKDALLRELIQHGCVEFSEMEEPPVDEDLIRRSDSKLMGFKTRLASVNHAVDLLNRYSPVKSKLLSAKPEVEGAVLLDESGLEAAEKLASAIVDNDDRIKRICAEESRQKGIAESLRPWLDLDMPLSQEGTKRSSVIMGTLSAKLKLETVEDALREQTEEAELFCVSQDKRSLYVVVVCIKEALTSVQECLRDFGFTAAALSGMDGTARECLAQADKTLKDLDAEKKSCTELIVSESVHRDELKLAADKLSCKIALAEADDRFCGTDSVVIMEGWMPAEREEELSRVFEKFDCAWDSCEPEEGEYPSVPVQLKNNKFSNSLNMVTNMYSLPAYGTVDANPIMAPFFILFYGLMMADMGYGILMILAAVIALKKIKPKEGSLAFCQLLLYSGIATFAMGALTGGLFGDAPYRLVHMFNPASTWQGLPCLFSPVRDSNMVLFGAMGLGLIHLNAGMVVSFVEKVKAGNLMDGIFEEGPLWVILIGGVMAGLKLLGVTDVLYTPGLVILIIGTVMLIFGAGRHSKGFGKVGAAFGCVYNTLTGWFGDVLSYSRIMALMLAGGVVGQVFNTIAAMPAENSGANFFTVLAFILIFVIGHALNFGLNLLGCFVHDLRLQCLEFFGKFYQDGGKPFQPLKYRSKYVSAKDN
jgi:V/A-type H+-transporting ATPase subunit I